MVIPTKPGGKNLSNVKSSSVAPDASSWWSDPKDGVDLGACAGSDAIVLRRLSVFAVEGLLPIISASSSHASQNKSK